MTEPKFELRGAVAFAHALVTGPDEAWNKEVKEAMTKAAMIVRDSARARVPKDQKILEKSIDFKLEQRGQAWIANIGPGVKSGDVPDHAAVVEEGRAAGAARPPVPPIAEWLSRRNLDPFAAFAVAKTIMERGIEAKPYMTPSLEDNRGKIEDALVGIPGGMISSIVKNYEAKKR